ncbi:MAG: hypothetical protein ACJ8AG_27120 [Ktedonobacteraceae bacterium]
MPRPASNPSDARSASGRGTRLLMKWWHAASSSKFLHGVARLLKRGSQAASDPLLANPTVDAHREETVRVIYTLYQDAPSLAQQGEQTVSTDRLITHQSEALVRWVAQLSGIDQDLGVRRESGIPACH